MKRKGGMKNVFELQLKHQPFFDKIDTDRSRQITKTEFVAYFKKNDPVFANDTDNQWLDFMFKLIDDDDSGKISPKEFIYFAEAYTTVKPKNDHDLIQVIFKMMDEDGSGFIEAHEMGRVLRAFGQAPTKRNLDAVLKEVDANGDGKIDLKEFYTMFS